MSDNPLVFDRSLARLRLKRALAAGYPDFLLARTADDLDERLAAVLRRFERAADLGTALPVARFWAPFLSLLFFENAGASRKGEF